mmetsp:Transcript_24547/g.36132  ORF Transcript_24547/g.36132 Transcript_24547/m.36132 type:complete len:214 (-) Transcript_24547:1911-2552(-)
MISPVPYAFKSGVTVWVISGQAAYTVSVTWPGAGTISPSTVAAIDSESFPPSMLGPSVSKKLLMASHVSHILAPSPSSFAAHIQLQLAFTSHNPVTRAHIRLVSASPAVNLACAALLINPFIGCSPTAVATPVTPKWLCARTATSASGVCRGPTHCCCDTRPVTLRSTLLVRNRLLPTSISRSTLSSAPATVMFVGRSRECRSFTGEVNVKVF